MKCISKIITKIELSFIHGGFDMLNDGNPWKYFYENNLLEFVGLPENTLPKIERYSLVDDCYLCCWEYDEEFS